MAKNKKSASLRDPVLAVLIHDMGAFVEVGGALYKPGAIDQNSKLELTLADQDEVSHIADALKHESEAS